MSQFLAMGGYAGYVWPAWVAAVLVTGGFTFAAIRRHRAALRALALLEGAGRS
jgi:heme exporter protein D